MNINVYNCSKRINFSSIYRKKNIYTHMSARPMSFFMCKYIDENELEIIRLKNIKIKTDHQKECFDRFA